MRYVTIREGWFLHGHVGQTLGATITLLGIRWVPVLWEGEEHPSWHRERGIRKSTSKEVKAYERRKCEELEG